MVPLVNIKDLAVVLAVLGAAFGLGSIMVNMQDVGSCPEQPFGRPFTCDHAYLVGGTYIWMRPLYTGLGIVSLALLVSALAAVLYWRLGRNPLTRPSAAAL